MQPIIAIVTHSDMPEGVADDIVLASELRKMDAIVQFTVWNDNSVDWSEFDVAVVRSTWDYHLQPEAWLNWLDRVSKSTQLLNPISLQKWNCDKSYLLDLAAQSISVVPTASPATAAELLQICEARQWCDVIIKPTIGASSFGAKRFNQSNIASDGVAHFQELKKTRNVIIQPYQKAIETERERSLVYINGHYSHAFSKPAFHSDLGNASLEKHSATDEEKQLAVQVLDALPEHPIFARIDLLPAESAPLLMEVELIEPELALHFSPDGGSVLAGVLLEAAKANR